MSEWKETDFGKIPNHWALKKVIDIKSNEKRAIAMGPFGSNIKAENFVEQGVPVIRGTNLNYAKYVDGEFVFLTEEKADELIGSNCKSGDLVFTHRGTIGQVGLVPSKFPRYVISQSGMKLSVNPDLIDNEFLFYFFKSEFGQFQILKYESQVGVPSISNPLTSLKEIEVPVPPIAEQKSIASILSALDDKIDLLHRQNATLEKIAETLFRQWFVVEAKEEWKSYKLKDLVKHVKPGTNFQPKRIEFGIPFLNVRNLNNGFLDLSETTKISKEEYQRVHKNWEPEENDLLISRIGTLGIVAVIQRSDLPVTVHYNMINLKARVTSYQFLYFLLKSQIFQEKYFSNIRQSVQEYVAIEDTENIEISLPIGSGLFGQQELVFNELYNKIKSNQTQIRTLTALRDTLLPKLMSGEVRVEI